MGDLFDGYTPAKPYGLPAWDEMFDATGVPRAAVRTLHDALQQLPPEEFEARAVARDSSFRDRGITFQLSGEERPFPLDLIPRVIPADEWAVVEAGVIQRVKGLEALLADLYGAGQILDDGVLPGSLSRRRSTSTGRRGVRPRRMVSGCTSRGSTWSGVGMAASTCWKTTSGARPACHM